MGCQNDTFSVIHAIFHVWLTNEFNRIYITHLIHSKGDSNGCFVHKFAYKLASHHACSIVLFRVDFSGGAIKQLVSVPPPQQA